MKIKIDEEDVIKNNIEVSRSLIGDAFFELEKERKAKKLFLAYKNIENALIVMGFDPQEKN